MVELPHYYFTDNKNQVHLLRPDYHLKSRKFEVVSQIKGETSSTSDYRAYKRIAVKNFERIDNKVIETNETSIQKIDDLKKLVNNKNITKEKIITFCKDSYD